MGRKSSSAINDELDLIHNYDVHIPTRTIFLRELEHAEKHGNEVSDILADRFLKNLHILEKASTEQITIILNTFGGSVTAAFAIYDAIQDADSPVIIYGTGAVMSAGSLIIQAADKRVLSPNCTFMIHAGTTGTGHVNPFEGFQNSEFDKKYMVNMYEILRDRINHKREKDGQAHMSKAAFKNMILESRWLFAEETIELGLADEIGKWPLIR